MDEGIEGGSPTAGPGAAATKGSGSLEVTEASQTLSAGGGSTSFDGELGRGDRIGRYTILQRIGAGGMGVVYAAYDETLDRRVALKLLHASTYAGTDPTDERASVGTKRMLREAQAMARLSHPNVVTVHDADAHQGRIFLAMEFVDGQTLRQWLSEQTDWRKILAAFIQAGRGLAAAHKAGLVHRDFKPDNVMIGSDDRARVMDFGLARASAEDEAATTTDEPAVESTGALSDTVTRTGAAVGTPAYMAPEQHLGAATDSRSDQFSFCVALYEALYGERPFRGKTLGELAYAVTQGERVPHRPRAEIPSYIYSAVDRGLNPKASARWPSMEELLTALDPVANEQASAKAKRGVGIAVLALMVGGIWWSENRRASAPPPCAAYDQPPEAWNPENGERMQAAFLGTKLPFSENAMNSARTGLEAYANEWVAARKETCEAHDVRREVNDSLTNLRYACLAARERQFNALVESFGAANARLVEKSLPAVSSLPPVASCLDLEALVQGVEAPPAELEEAVAKAESELARASHLELAGEYKASLDAAQAVLEGPAAAYLPLRAKAEFRTGWAHTRGGQSDEAESALFNAYRSARAAGDDHLALEVSALLVYVLGGSKNEFEHAREWAQNGLAEVERVEPGGLVHAVLLTNLGTVSTQGGKYEEAAGHHQKALDLYTKMFSNDAGELEDHPRVAVVLNNLGIAKLEGGHAKEAAEIHERALAMRKRLFGDEHPDVASSMGNLGNAVRRLGEYERALELQEAALRIREKTLGPNHRRVASSVGSLAIAYAQSGNIEKATELFRDAADRFEKGLGPDDPMVADSLSNLAQALTMQGKLDEALETQQRSLAIKRKALGPDHPTIPTSLTSIAEILGQQDKVEEAIAVVREALTIQRRTLDPNHPSLAGTLIRLGDFELALGRSGEALESMEEVLRIRQAREGEALDLAEAKFAVARALNAARRDPKRAAAYISEAETSFKEIGKPAAPYLAELEAYKAAQGR